MKQRYKNMTKYRVPTYMDLLWPTIKALKALGGSASNDEIVEEIASAERLPREVLNVMHGDGSKSELTYRAAWSRTLLRKVGAIENVSIGMWKLTEVGDSLQDKEQAKKLVKQPSGGQKRPPRVPETKKVHLLGADNWKGDLLTAIRKMSPKSSSRFFKQILLESGFTSVELIKQVDDQYIEAIGILNLGITSFRARFRCKMSLSPIESYEIRDLRTDTAGTANKSIFMTTGEFTPDAEREASRSLEPSIELIDASRLCDLVKDLGLGLSTRQVEVVEFHPEYFDGI